MNADRHITHNENRQSKHKRDDKGKQYKHNRNVYNVKKYDTKPKRTTRPARERRKTHEIKYKLTTTQNRTL